MPLPSFQVSLESNEIITPKVRKLVFKLDDPKTISYKPGQFVSFMLPSDDDRPIKRSYSISNMEKNTDGVTHIEFVIAYVDGGKASELFFNAEPGMTMEMTGPFGLLCLLEELPQRVFLVGTGTGVAPYRCMIEQIKARPDTEFHILFGAQYYEDMFYLDDFNEVAKLDHVHFHPCLSREDKEGCVSGYVQTKLAELNPNPETDMAYLCGNPNMVDEVFNMLQEKNFGVKQVKREKYVFSRF
ncbi:FAD-binding oxidoreductase [Kangiella sediminilitoris]|uniref:Oxidoreductase FAD/NAD(P)-binding domain protein n=1 Tax=Kangiella sediminilitoris TaxID=1144748 RepID=A0A1B3BA35_9GAMM|nr:FAD-binding oxidoreductase [Kangiella sediminilitoris]AOE49628.1 Oxidoreductase FAD/NAD(P)-binding domain protein [Kangiella sediminilitoris]